MGAGGRQGYHRQTVLSGASGLAAAFLLVVFILASVVGGTYWWMWVSGQRERLPSWGVWLYVACGLVGSAALLGFIALYYRS